jgi:hypothetical protein
MHGSNQMCGQPVADKGGFGLNGAMFFLTAPNYARQSDQEMVDLKQGILIESWLVLDLNRDILIEWYYTVHCL